MKLYEPVFGFIVLLVMVIACGVFIGWQAGLAMYFIISVLLTISMLIVDGPPITGAKLEKSLALKRIITFALFPILWPLYILFALLY